MNIIEARYQRRKGRGWTEWGEMNANPSETAELAYRLLTSKERGWKFDGPAVKVTVERSSGIRTQYRLPK